MSADTVEQSEAPAEQAGKDLSPSSQLNQNHKKHKSPTGVTQGRCFVDSDTAGLSTGKKFTAVFKV